MKAKIGNIEIEGTPEEIKDFIINSPNKSEKEFLPKTLKTQQVQTGSDTHSELNKEKN